VQAVVERVQGLPIAAAHRVRLLRAQAVEALRARRRAAQRAPHLLLEGTAQALRLARTAARTRPGARPSDAFVCQIRVAAS